MTVGERYFETGLLVRNASVGMTCDETHRSRFEPALAAISCQSGIIQLGPAKP